MIDGHGDDMYKYEGILARQAAGRPGAMNFSSNIPSFADLSALEEHLCRHMSVIRSYPEPSPQSLEVALAHYHGVAPDEVMVTSGATEAIYLIAQLLRDEGTYTVVRPTFSEYDSACRMYDMRETEDGGVCWLCNPNNPTGTLLDTDAVREMAARHRYLVVDQSYEDYTPVACRPLAMACPEENVFTLHSMTKRYCVPGLRLGYVTAPAALIGHLRQLRRPWSVNALALEAGRWLVEQNPRLLDMPAYLAEARRLCSMLNQVPGIHAFGTQTNFMLCTIEEHTAAYLKSYLINHHAMLIRDASNFFVGSEGISGVPLLPAHYFRVAAQRPEENDALVDALRELMT